MNSSGGGGRDEGKMMRFRRTQRRKEAGVRRFLFEIPFEQTGKRNVWREESAEYENSVTANIGICDFLSPRNTVVAPTTHRIPGLSSTRGKGEPFDGP